MLEQEATKRQRGLNQGYKGGKDYQSPRGKRNQADLEQQGVRER